MLSNLFFSYDFAKMPVFFLLILAMFLVVFVRYIIIAGIFMWYFYKFKQKEWQPYKLNKKPYPKKQFQKEIFWSLITSLIFGLGGAITAVLWQKGYTKIYIEFHFLRDLWYMPLSLLLAMFIHETYYYWLHRLMHHPKIYRLIHKKHHESLISSPWTAFSFHPLEALLEAIILPLLVCFLPLHYYMIVIHLTIMTISSIINHLDIEIYPKNTDKHWFGRWWIGATHHALHHSQFRYNFGLYFTIWDKIMHTESPDYHKNFENIKK